MDLDKVKYWSELSDYDYDTADAMLRTGRYLYVGEGRLVERVEGVVYKR